MRGVVFNPDTLFQAAINPVPTGSMGRIREVFSIRKVHWGCAAAYCIALEMTQARWQVPGSREGEDSPPYMPLSGGH